MAALMEARLTGVAVGSAPEVALEMVDIAEPRDIGAGAVDHWPTYAAIRCWNYYFPFGDSTIFSDANHGLTRRLDERHDLDLFIGVRICRIERRILFIAEALHLLPYPRQRP